MKKRCLLLIVLLQAMMVAAQQGWQDSGLLAYTAETGVQQSEDEAKEAFWHEVMEETRSYLDDGNHMLAFEKVGEVLNDSENYTSDPDEKCNCAVMLNDILQGVMAKMYEAAARVDLNNYFNYSTAYMRVEQWQKELLISAVAQGSKKALGLFNIVNMRYGGGAAVAPNEPVDYNKNAKPYLKQKEETCSLCNGTGKIRTQSVTTYGVSSAYVDEKCPSCNGTGKIKRLDYNY